MVKHERNELYYNDYRTHHGMERTKAMRIATLVSNGTLSLSCTCCTVKWWRYSSQNHKKK
jgi:hypothetical protein